MQHYGDKIEIAKQKKEYPCHQQFYEAQFACADDTFEFMLELAYYRQLNGMTYEKFLNNELFTPATIYDTPDPHARLNYTY